MGHFNSNLLYKMGHYNSNLLYKMVHYNSNLLYKMGQYKSYLLYKMGHCNSNLLYKMGHYFRSDGIYIAVAISYVSGLFDPWIGWYRRPICRSQY